MRAGKFNCRIAIQRRDGGNDDYGQPTDTWVEVAKVWANIMHKSGLETVKSAVDISVVQTSVQIRYRTDVTSSMRAVHGTTIYDIQAVLPDEVKREYCYLVCQEAK